VNADAPAGSGTGSRSGVSPLPEASPTCRRPIGALAAAYVALVTLTLAFYVTRIPIQLSDGASNMISVVDQSAVEIFFDKTSNEAYFRPLMWPPYKMVMDLSGGAYFGWFKGLHVVQLLVLLLLLVRWLRIRDGADLAVLPFAVAVLVGGHTFAGTLREAFPINHFLSIAICVLGAATVSAERWRLGNDVAAILLFVYASLTLETGLLVWVVLVWAFAIGWRGVSKPALALVTLGVAAYLYIRFAVLDTGTPGLTERESGWGFALLGKDELNRRFSDHPLRYYAYNVASSLSGILFAEPRAGVWAFLRGIVQGGLEPWRALNVACASGVTVLIASWAWTQRRSWSTRSFTHGDRVVLMLPVVVLANALFCYAYVKDVVLSTAGVFVAAAAFVAMRGTLGRLGHASRPIAVFGAVLLTALSAAWAVKHVGIHYNLWEQNVSVRREWAQVDRWLQNQEIDLVTPASRSVKARLEFEALSRPVAPPWPEPRWTRRWFDDTQ